MYRLICLNLIFFNLFAHIFCIYMYNSLCISAFYAIAA